MTRLSIFFFALLSCCIHSIAQTKGTLVNTVIPPSPASAVFRQYAGYTPNLATGTVSIPVSLYNIQLGDFSIPLSLQYYTQGIKFTDDPYPAGYGWILSPGLRITRTILGRPDMYYPMDIRTNPDFDYQKSAVYDEGSHKHTQWEYNRQMTDTQHDLFTVHLPNGDYPFMLKKEENGTYRAYTVNNRLKITVNSLVEFEVKDENGVTYCFGTADEADGLYNEYYQQQYCTAWMLRKIILPGKDREIDFYWEKVRHSALRRGPYFSGDILKDYKERWNADIPENGNPEHTSAEAEGLLADYGEYNEVLHLKRITFPQGSVELTYKETLNPLLTKLSVKNTNAVNVKEIKFGYGTGADQPLLQRIEISGEGTYRFEYNPTRFGGNSNAQDYWGYYNAKDNRSLVPRMQVKTYNNRAAGGYTSYQTYGTADRSVNAEAMKAYILTKVVYPTGGYSAYEYEPHKFEGNIPTTEGLAASDKVRLTEGGGLRVVRITSSAADGSPEITKTYKYGPGENGMANVLYEPTLDTFIDELGGYQAEVVGTAGKIGYNLRILFLNPQSNYMRYAVNAPALWYDTVTEYTGGEAKTVYSYSRLTPENQTAGLNAVRDFPYKVPYQYNTLFSKGCLLTAKTDFKKNGNGYSPVKKSTYGYKLEQATGQALQDLAVTRTGINQMGDGPDYNYTNGRLNSGGTDITGNMPDRDYMSNPYTVRFYYEVPEKEETVFYTENGNLTELITYTYSDGLMTSKTVLESDGGSVTEHYSYPKDYQEAATEAQQNVLKKMYEMNIQSPRYLTIRTRDGKTEQTRHEFAPFGNNLYKIYQTFYKQSGQQETERATYDYDEAGNLRSLTRSGGHKTAYLWAYNHTLPVAFIDGLDYKEVASLAGQTTMDNLNGIYGNMVMALQGIRQKTDGLALMTSYLYEPLVGITQQTSPNGENTYYQYDRQNRLSAVCNHQQLAMQRFAYHYQDDERLTVSFTTQSTYSQGTVLKLAAAVTGGSRLYNYEWKLKDGNGKTLQTVSSQTTPSLELTLQQTGTMTLTCTVTDRMTQETAVGTRSFTVKTQSICFSNISNAPGQTQAYIIAPGTCRISLYLTCETGEKPAVFMVDGTRHTLSGANGMNLEVELTPGTHAFSISLEDDNTGYGWGEIHITGAEGYTLGSPTIIRASL